MFQKETKSSFKRKCWRKIYFIAFKSSHWRKHWRKHHLSFDTVLFAFANCPSGFVALYKHLTWEKWERNELLNSIRTREKQRARSREQHAGFAWSMCVKCLAGPVCAVKLRGGGWRCRVGADAHNAGTVLHEQEGGCMAWRARLGRCPQGLASWGHREWWCMRGGQGLCLAGWGEHPTKPSRDRWGCVARRAPAGRLSL